LATVAAVYDYDWKEVEKQFRKDMAAESTPPLGKMMREPPPM